jgi:hypothetical protein
MIPQRLPGSEICGNGLKDRVTACRKRLRVNRVAQRSHSNNGAEELIPKTTSSVSDFQGYAGDYPVPASVIRMNYGAAFTGVEDGESETLQLVAEQEVGIT